MIDPTYAPMIYFGGVAVTALIGQPIAIVINWLDGSPEPDVRKAIIAAVAWPVALPLLIVSAIVVLVTCAIRGDLWGLGDDDVFAGTRRSIALPLGWECDHARWGWRVMAYDPEESNATLGLYVWTRHKHTGAEKWRPVGSGEGFYSEGDIIGDLPGTWRQEVRRLPTNAKGVLVDPPERLLPDSIVETAEAPPPCRNLT